MKYDFTVKVSMAPRIFDPQAATLERSLKKMNYPIEKISMGKNFELSVEAPSEDEARAVAAEIAEKILSNPVLEIFELERAGK